ncbi:type II secretion system F family protein [Vibrio metschnikovii]|uniref:type II secretion system F family protein n=1 Tax=Vibrio metschnikovii TaxID=28172 RepID=UPI001C2FEB98|nr:type II secretion system F family protein [Vibrio metschnikovii]
MAVSIGALLLIVSLRSERKKQLWRDFHHHEQTPKQKLAWLDKLSANLNNLFSSDKQQVQQKILAAGFYNPKLATYFMPIKYGLLLVGCAVLYILSLRFAWQGNSLFIALAVWLVVSLILPDSYLAMRGRQLSYKISNKLPYLLDLMAVCVQTGMTIEAAISYLAKEMKGFDKDISYLLIKTDDRARMVGLEAALDELYARVPSNEMRSFVMTLKQSLQYGSSIYSVLTTLSADIREVQMLQIEEKIGKLAAKMSIPLIIFIMVPIVILIAAPGIIRMMANA